MTTTAPRHTIGTALHFANGHRAERVPAVLAPDVVGIDDDGDLLVPLMDTMPDYLTPLTPCCHASGKGYAVDSGVVCRGCYEEVDAKYGGPSALASAVTACPVCAEVLCRTAAVCGPVAAAEAAAAERRAGC